MLCMDFYRLFLESPGQAVALFLAMMVIAILGLCVNARYKRKEADDDQKRAEEEIWRRSRRRHL